MVKMKRALREWILFLGTILIPVFSIVEMMLPDIEGRIKVPLWQGLAVITATIVGNLVNYLRQSPRRKSVPQNAPLSLPEP